ncbi:MAG: phosphate acyltransferase PlsX [Coriobacteriales bacterium]|nr:phosphate acyltransferase PlsX [Coriobacteriales bacterium]
MDTKSDTHKTVIAVDVLGGDAAPAVVLAGVQRVLAQSDDTSMILVGPAEVVEPLATEYPQRLRAVATTESIGMDEHPAEAVKAKKDSSIVVGCRLVRQGEAAGFFSAGSTGACMVAATLIIGRAKGVSRPAVTTILPAPTGPAVLLDCGANADVRPEMLLQFAQMGAIYARDLLGVAKPRVGLLNIGSEASKGSALAVEAHALLHSSLPGFAGNVEGTRLFSGDYDVIVTDGFTGNVVLKTVEGTASVLFRQIKTVFGASLKTRLAAALIQGDLRALKDDFNPEKVGGAPLLGCKGAVVIGHGSSGVAGIANGIEATAALVRAKVAEKIAASLTVATTPGSTAAAAGHNGDDSFVSFKDTKESSPLCPATKAVSTKDGGGA